MVHTLVVDYGQNMKFQWLGEKKSGRMYYYIPLNVHNLSLVNRVKCTSVATKEKTYAHICTEVKGGNNLSLLIMKTIKLLEWGNT